MPGITGLLGPNGLAKTTLLRMMTGSLLRREAQSPFLAIRFVTIPRSIAVSAVMSEHETVYEFMKGADFVRMMAA